MNGLTPRSAAHLRRNRRESMQAWLDRLDARQDRLAVAPHFVYRAFDEYGLLLYIGCTKDVEARMVGHNYKPWHSYMDHLSVAGPFDGMKAGRAAEKQAIDSERAFFNATQADINRTNKNINEAKRRLAWCDITSPILTLGLDENDKPVYSDSWDDDYEAYNALVEELRADLKASDFPYLTDEDRMALYLEARAAMAAAA